MSLNLGLECLNTGVKTVSTEQLMSEYVSCEELVSATERFSAYGDQLFTTFDNLLAIRKTAKQFNSNEAMTVLNSLVGSEFGGTFSMEEATEANKTVWQKIKDFFAKIWEWIKTFFYRVLNFFTDVDNRLGKYEVALNSLPDDAKLEWHYKGIPALKMTGFCNTLQTIAKSAFANVTESAKIKDALKDAIDNNIDKLIPKEGNAVSGKNATQSVIKNLRYCIKTGKDAKNDMAGAYTTAKAATKKAEGADNIKAAKLEQEKIAAQVKFVSKAMSAIMRTGASVCANIPLKNQAKKK